MNRISSFLGTTAVAAALVLSPVIASAEGISGSAHAGAGIFISPRGIIKVVDADVTAVGNGVVDAMSQFGNLMLNFIVNTSASTTIKAGGSANASTTAIAVGDKVSFVGSLASSTNSVLTVTATKIRDLTNFIASSTRKHGDNDADDDAALSGHSSVDVGTSTDADWHGNVSAKVGDSHDGVGFLGGLHLGFGGDN
ncbi:MAG: hypothetical protein KGJ34_01395 [Patescibacteria group bacterium]|nr:hypothetical protein [Patescibacteria group bacterium]